MYNRNTAWSNYWLQHLSWRELQKMKRFSEKSLPTSRLEKSRCKRIMLEWERRKHGGSGVLFAEGGDAEW